MSLLGYKLVCYKLIAFILLPSTAILIGRLLFSDRLTSTAGENPRLLDLDFNAIQHRFAFAATIAGFYRALPLRLAHVNISNRVK